MSQFEINLASPEDDAALGTLLESTPMGGDIELAFARRPSYFAAAAVDGHFVQVVTVREKRTGRIVGMGSRSIFRGYVEGDPADIGYLSGLRLLREYRGRGGLLARGFRKFRELHADGRAPFYLTTVAAENREARTLLTSERGGLPVYHPWGEYHTLTIATAATPPPESNEATFRFATRQDAGTISQFLAENGPRRQFFPLFSDEEFAGDPKRLIGLEPESLLLAWVGDRLVGTLGLWNQSHFKQSVVTGYSRRLALARPVYNSWARLRRKPPLPPPGRRLNIRYAAIPVLLPEFHHLASPLVQTAAASLRDQPDAILLLGLHERDPLFPFVRPLSGHEYVTLMYLVHWPDERPDIERLVNRPPYLELGCL